MTDATYYNTHYWPSEADQSAFKSKFEALRDSSDAKISEIDTSAWFDVASDVISLCRSRGGAGYSLQSELYSGTSNHLPGYYEGYVKLIVDPTCGLPKCA